MLADFLSSHEIDVLDRLALKFDRKKYDRNLKEEGREEERWQLLIAMVNDGEIIIENAAKRLNITPEEFQEKLTATNNK